FFVDGDAALLNACIGAFMPEIAARRVDVAVVKMKKEMTTDVDGGPDPRLFGGGSVLD
ncbi:MAG: hypothetical protein JO252_09430, partial [Planctomycetaceae bacterium]|nr:hypothetical protein [Planctomycetaceae bacterium]